jgi:sister-chromatid-cohesion protein PDS5
MVAQTRHAVVPSPKKLAFHDKLIVKGLSTDLLIKKLQALHRELADMEQELVDVNSLGVVRKELINSSILLHKDRGVKAYAACCLADILRLTAPDAPYTQGELRDIFQFFFRQLTNGLKGSDSPYYTEYFHLLESLSTVKSVVLVCDLQNADELMVEIFRDFFQLVRRDLAKKIEMFVADILVALIDECQVLPAEVLETIMAQFMDKNAVSGSSLRGRWHPCIVLIVCRSAWNNPRTVSRCKCATPPRTSSTATSRSTSPKSSLPSATTTSPKSGPRTSSSSACIIRAPPSSPP